MQGKLRGTVQRKEHPPQTVFPSLFIPGGGLVPKLNDSQLLVLLESNSAGCYKNMSAQLIILQSPKFEYVLHITLWPRCFKEWSISNFPFSLTRNITPHSMKNLASHSLMIILPILATSLIHSVKGWENVLFELRSAERVTNNDCPLFSRKHALRTYTTTLLLPRSPCPISCRSVGVGRSCSVRTAHAFKPRSECGRDTARFPHTHSYRDRLNWTTLIWSLQEGVIITSDILCATIFWVSSISIARYHAYIAEDVRNLNAANYGVPPPPEFNLSSFNSFPHPSVRTFNIHLQHEDWRFEHADIRLKHSFQTRKIRVQHSIIHRSHVKQSMWANTLRSFFFNHTPQFAINFREWTEIGTNRQQKKGRRPCMKWSRQISSSLSLPASPEVLHRTVGRT